MVYVTYFPPVLRERLGDDGCQGFLDVVNCYYDIMHAQRYGLPHSLIIEFPPALDKALGEEASRALIDYLNQRYEVSGVYQRSPEYDNQ